MSTNNNSNGTTIMLPGGWFTIGVGGGGGSLSGGDLTGEYSVPKAKKKDKDGCDCKKCKEYYPYAEPNQDDGTLICYKCRSGW